MEFKNIGIVSDHAGFSLKENIVQHLQSLSPSLHVSDYGPGECKKKVDYPDFAIKVARSVSEKKLDGAIAICGTGLGMCIVANKFHQIQAICPWDEYSARMGREHNHANILCLGARSLSFEKAKTIVETWLMTPFQGERHKERLQKIRLIEKENSSSRNE